MRFTECPDITIMDGPTSVTCRRHLTTSRNTALTLGLVPRAMELHMETTDNTFLLRTHRLHPIKDTRQSSTELHTLHLPVPTIHRQHINKDTRQILRTLRLLVPSTHRLRLNQDTRQISTELHTLLLNQDMRQISTELRTLPLPMRTRLLNHIRGTRQSSMEFRTLLPHPMVTERRPAIVRSASIHWMP